MSKSYAKCPKCFNTTNGYHIYSCKDCGKIYCASCMPDNCGHCGNGLRSLFNTVRDEGTIQNESAIERQRELDKEREERYQYQSPSPSHSSSSDSSSGSSGGSGTSSTGGIIYLGLGLLFMAWLYFNNKSQIPSQAPSLQGTAAQTTNPDNTISQFTVSVEKMKSDLMGTDLRGLSVLNINEIKTIVLTDSVRTNNTVQYTAAIHIQKESEPAVSYYDEVSLNYYLINGVMTFKNVTTNFVNRVVENQQSDFSGTIGDKPIEIHLNSNSNNNLGKFVYLNQPDYDRQIAKNSDFSGNLINLDIIADSFSLFKAVLSYDESTHKYSGLATYHDNATDSIFLWTKQ